MQPQIALSVLRMTITPIDPANPPDMFQLRMAYPELAFVFDTMEDTAELLACAPDPDDHEGLKDELDTALTRIEKLEERDIKVVKHLKKISNAVTAGLIFANP